MQFVDFPGFCCNSFDSMTILHSFAISLQFNWIVQDHEWIASNLQSDHSPQDCKRLCRHCKGFGNLVAINFDRTDCDQNRGNPGLIEGIWLQSISIVSGLHPICNQGAIVRFVKRQSGLWQDCNGPRRPLLGFTGHILQSRRNPLSGGCNSVPSGPIKAQSVLIALGLHKIQNMVAIHTDCGYGGLDCERIVTTQMSLFWGLRGIGRIAEDPRAPVQACP